MDVAVISSEKDLQLVEAFHYGRIVDTVIVNGRVGNLETAFKKLKKLFRYILYVPSSQAWTVEKDFCKDYAVVYGQEMVWKHPEKKWIFLLCTLWTIDGMFQVTDNTWLHSQLKELQGPIVIATRYVGHKFARIYGNIYLNVAGSQQTRHLQCFFGSTFLPEKYRNKSKCVTLNYHYCDVDDCCSYAIGNNRCMLHQPFVQPVPRYRLLVKDF